MVFVKKARKQLGKLDKSTQRNIRDKLKLLAADSPLCDVKKIQTEQNLYRLRVGPYRVFFERESQILRILVLEITRRTSTTY